MVLIIRVSNGQVVQDALAMTDNMHVASFSEYERLLGTKNVTFAWRWMGEDTDVVAIVDGATNSNPQSFQAVDALPKPFDQTLPAANVLLVKLKVIEDDVEPVDFSTAQFQEWKAALADYTP